MLNRDPYPETRRAPYALPEGVPALQDDPVVTRRRMLLVVVGSATLGATLGFLVNRGIGASASGASASPVASQGDPLLIWGRRTASSAEPTLVANAVAFLAIAESFPADAGLTLGLERLVGCAEENPELQISGFTLRERLVRTMRVCAPHLPERLLVRMKALVPDAPSRIRGK